MTHRLADDRQSCHLEAEASGGGTSPVLDALARTRYAVHLDALFRVLEPKARERHARALAVNERLDALESGQTE